MDKSTKKKSKKGTKKIGGPKFQMDIDLDNEAEDLPRADIQIETDEIKIVKASHVKIADKQQTELRKSLQHETKIEKQIDSISHVPLQIQQQAKTIPQVHSPNPFRQQVENSSIQFSEVNRSVPAVVAAKEEDDVFDVTEPLSLNTKPKPKKQTKAKPKKKQTKNVFEIETNLQEELDSQSQPQQRPQTKPFIEEVEESMPAKAFQIGLVEKEQSEQGQSSTVEVMNAAKTEEEGNSQTVNAQIQKHSQFEATREQFGSGEQRLNEESTRPQEGRGGVATEPPQQQQSLFEFSGAVLSIAPKPKGKKEGKAKAKKKEPKRAVEIKADLQFELQPQQTLRHPQQEASISPHSQQIPSIFPHLREANEAMVAAESQPSTEAKEDTQAKEEKGRDFGLEAAAEKEQSNNRTSSPKQPQIEAIRQGPYAMEEQKTEQCKRVDSAVDPTNQQSVIDFLESASSLILKPKGKKQGKAKPKKKQAKITLDIKANLQEELEPHQQQALQYLQQKPQALSPFSETIVESKPQQDASIAIVGQSSKIAPRQTQLQSNILVQNQNPGYKLNIESQMLAQQIKTDSPTQQLNEQDVFQISDPISSKIAKPKAKKEGKNKQNKKKQTKIILQIEADLQEEVEPQPKPHPRQQEQIPLAKTHLEQADNDVLSIPQAIVGKRSNQQQNEHGISDAPIQKQPQVKQTMQDHSLNPAHHYNDDISMQSAEVNRSVPAVEAAKEEDVYFVSEPLSINTKPKPKKQTKAKPKKKQTKNVFEIETNLQEELDSQSQPQQRPQTKPFIEEVEESMPAKAVQMSAVGKEQSEQGQSSTAEVVNAAKIEEEGNGQTANAQIQKQSQIEATHEQFGSGEQRLNEESTRPQERRGGVAAEPPQQQQSLFEFSGAVLSIAPKPKGKKEGKAKAKKKEPKRTVEIKADLQDAFELQPQQTLRFPQQKPSISPHSQQTPLISPEAHETMVAAESQSNTEAKGDTQAKEEKGRDFGLEAAAEKEQSNNRTSSPKQPQIEAIRQGPSVINESLSAKEEEKAEADSRIRTEEGKGVNTAADPTNQQSVIEFLEPASSLIPKPKGKKQGKAKPKKKQAKITLDIKANLQEELEPQLSFLRSINKAAPQVPPYNSTPPPPSLSTHIPESAPPSSVCHPQPQLISQLISLIRFQNDAQIRTMRDRMQMLQEDIRSRRVRAHEQPKYRTKKTDYEWIIEENVTLHRQYQQLNRP